MAYVKTNWQTGDVITAAKLNNMETGIYDAIEAAADAFVADIDNPQDGDVIKYDGTAGKWVNGAASGGGGGVLYVESVDGTLDKNYTEITQAIADGKIVAGITNDDGIDIQYLAAAYEENSKYYVLFKSGTLSGLYVADTATGTLTLDVGGDE